MRFSFLIVFGIASSAGGLGQSAPPAITSQPASATVNAGQAVTLSVAATGNPAPAIQWFKDGRAIPGATNPSLTFASVFGGDAGSYTANVSNVVNGTNYTLTTAAAVLTVVTTPPTITTQPVSQTVVAGGNVTFSVAATGSPPMHYRWYKDGVEISGATSSSLRINGVQPVDRGIYSATVTNWMNEIDTVSAGGAHTVFLTSGGLLWGMGYNIDGRLGLAGSRITSPVQMMAGIRAVAAGESYTMFIKADGTLWGVGVNRYGQLGDGTATSRATPVQVATGVSGVSAGADHTMLIKTDGTLWVWGGNSVAGGIPIRSSPVQVGTATTWLAVSHNSGTVIGIHRY